MGAGVAQRVRALAWVRGRGRGAAGTGAGHDGSRRASQSDR